MDSRDFWEGAEEGGVFRCKACGSYVKEGDCEHRRGKIGRPLGERPPLLLKPTDQQSGPDGHPAEWLTKSPSSHSDGLVRIRVRSHLLVLCALALMLFTQHVVGADGQPITPPQATVSVYQLVDATSSLDGLMMPDGRTPRREPYLNTDRSIIIAATQAKGILTLARLCGAIRHLWGPRPVTRGDFASLGSIIRNELTICTPELSADPGGTDLLGGLRSMAEYASTSIPVYVGDCLNQPGGQWPPDQEVVHRYLDRLSAQQRDRLWLIGCDPRAFGSLRQRVEHTFSLYELDAAIRALREFLSKGGR